MKSNNQGFKEEHSSRLVGGVEMGSQAEMMCSKVVDYTGKVGLVD